MTDEDQRPFTPKTLAERWHCSERHVRNMLNNGDVPFFRLGGKLIRIKRKDVEEFERSGGTAS
jgi:excisionase family DNA binding protein